LKYYLKFFKKGQSDEGEVFLVCTVETYVFVTNHGCLDLEDTFPFQKKKQA
jgi:hypothetical protein